MPIHPETLRRFAYIEGVPSMQAFFEDPRYAERRAAFESWPNYEVPDVAVRAAEAPGPHGPVPVRVYGERSGAAGRPALVWMHGGAFMMGDLDMPEADWTSREVAQRADAVVISVDYRLCQNGVHYPVPHDDVVAAVRWVRENAAELGVDPAWISVGGASAGANLAAGAALKLRDEDDRPPAHLIFAYGVAHAVLPPLSPEIAELMNHVPQALLFPPEMHGFFNRTYLGGPLSKADGYAFPILADLRGMCPTLVLNAEYDDLRVSGEAFAAALAATGVDVRQVMVRSVLHGYLNLAATVGPTAAALDLIAATVARPVPLDG
ncbi:alpha/beta hydrolase [Actinocorallia herbida]|nr:alpha/beta hydrolase [Actinocorallia herbida]